MSQMTVLYTDYHHITKSNREVFLSKQKMCCRLPRVQCLWPRAPILSITSVTSLLQPPSSDPQFPSTSHNTDRDAGTRWYLDIYRW